MQKKTTIKNDTTNLLVQAFSYMYQIGYDVHVVHCSYNDDATIKI